MNRILIIEDNKTLANLISKKLVDKLGFEVDIAYKLSEAKLFLKMYKYFVVLTDLNLPDAPNGEVVDYLISKEAKIIVLTSNVDKEFRKKILDKNIIDYVAKDGINNIKYVISTIKRLHKNQNHKVLVVDDSMVFRKQMQSMLENLFINAYTVAHGEEALGMLQTHPDISLVLTDYNMPVMDGLELTKTIREKKSKNEISIIAISSNETDEVNSLFLKHGANDFIKKPFSKEEFSCRVNNALEAIENIETITNHSNRDYITGLYNRRFFYKHMKEYLNDDSNNGGSTIVATIDIDDFKKLNDAYGDIIGNKVITEVSEILTSLVERKHLVAHFGADEFCIVFKNSDNSSAFDTLEKIRMEVLSSPVLSDDKKAIHFSISIGASILEDADIDEALNQADMMLYKAKQNGKNQTIFE